MSHPSGVGYTDVVIAFAIFAVGILLLPAGLKMDFQSFLSGFCFGAGGIAGSRAIHTVVRRRQSKANATDASSAQAQ